MIQLDVNKIIEQLGIKTKWEVFRMFESSRKIEEYDYDMLVESVASGLLEGETFSEALNNYNASSDVNVLHVLDAFGKSLQDLSDEVGIHYID